MCLDEGNFGATQTRVLWDRKGRSFDFAVSLLLFLWLYSRNCRRTCSLARVFNGQSDLIIINNNLFKVMIKNISVPEAELTIEQRLMQICKKSINTDNKPEIDFLLLERQMQVLQNLQSKTVQQIVEFVDEHLEEFIQINKKFQGIQVNIEESQLLIKKIIPKLDTYKSKIFSPESKIQQFMSSYQKKLMQEQLAEIAKQEAEFLLGFVHEFEAFISINLEQLNQKHKYNIVRFLRKKQYIKSIFDHPFVQTIMHGSHDLSIMLANITEQLQFYLSQQLSRVASSRELRNQNRNGIQLLEQMRIWYQYMGKRNHYYETIEDSIIGKKLSVLELLLTTHKQSLIVGNEQGVVKKFFSQLFQMVRDFPIDYPNERILKIIYKFLGKKQLNFIYSYVVPAFPISYSAYKSAVSKLQNKALQSELESRHGWNLKLWADLRIKTIMDRSGKDKDKSLTKWIDITFKKSFMIHGVKNYMIKLAFLLVNRYCMKIQEQTQFSSKAVNDNFVLLDTISELLRLKLKEGFQEQLVDSSLDEIKKSQIQEEINKIVKNIYSTIQKTLKKWIINNMRTLIDACKNSLEPCKSFVLNVISKKERNRGLQNSHQNILKPLRGYFKSNPQISEKCCSFIECLTLEIVQKHYDSEYAKQIYNYCNSNSSTEQLKQVMQAIGKQRYSLFEGGRKQSEDLIMKQGNRK